MSLILSQFLVQLGFSSGVMNGSTQNLDKRRTSFDRIATQYDRYRPGYPHAVFEDTIALSQIPTDGRILEIGCGTGQATIPFARRGYAIDCIELGANLAALARENLAAYPNVKVSIGKFETWHNDEHINFNLVISATAFHWIDPTIGYQKVAQVLKPNGAIALFWNKHVQTERSADFCQAVKTVYKRVVPELAANFSGLPHPDRIPTPVRAEIDRSGLFSTVTIRKYPWEQVYTASDYLNLLTTQSDIQILDNSIRDRLLDGIAELINTQFTGQITQEYLTILYLAHRN
jgi:SAM-dependent methyltransferase